ncbi:MAG: glycosyl transferase [Deltaproteobacteria bacterium RIFOXYD12_FULL_50_9]|nr:MAG: glycosyl transferase [Deltaproteobacteria bacterium RIFOXYD12_FULL_50_9]
MKILLTAHQFFPDYRAGTEVLTYSVARELIERGHEVRVLTAHPTEQKMLDEERFDEYQYEGISVYRFYHAYTPMAGQCSMVELSFDNHLAAKHFKQILEEFKPDVVHFFHLNRLGTGLIELAVRAEIPAFMTPTDFWAICPTVQLVLSNGSLCRGPSVYAGNCVKHFAESTQNGLIAILAKYLPTTLADLLARLTQADLMPSYPHQVEVKALCSRLAINVARLNQLNKIVAPNSFMSKLLVRYGISPHLIIQASYGIDVNRNVEIAPRRSSSHPFRVGYIGTLAQHKGCHILIEAFKSLPSGRAILKIYGRTEEFPVYLSKLKQLAAQQNFIEFCGVFHNSKIAEVMADLDVLVVPSLWYENTPLVVYSAQAARCPVVASDFPGISEVVRDEVNGLLFEAGNPKDLARQLARLINEPGLAEQLSTNAQQPKSTSSYVDELLSLWTSA